MIEIILHSDDLGITQQSTKHILAAWRSGHLDGFSIIANGDAVDEIPPVLAREAERSVRIAVHFNLTEGRSSAPPSEVPLLVDASGELRHTFGSLMLVSLFASPAKRIEFARQIAAECTAQIIAVRSLCSSRVITAIDGHNHIHMIPGVFTTVAQAACAAGIPEIRISAEPFYIEKSWRDWLRPFWLINLIKHILLRLLSVNARRVARQAGLNSPDAIIGVLYSGRMSEARALRGIEAADGATRVEIVFHVGRAHNSEAKRWRHAAYSTFHLSSRRDTERIEIGCLAKKIRIPVTSLSMDRPIPDQLNDRETRNRNRL